jgi:hypothetical protein
MEFCRVVHSAARVWTTLQNSMITGFRGSQTRTENTKRLERRIAAAAEAWTRDRRRLRFSKTGDANVERAYRTHWVSPRLADMKRARRDA